VVAAKVVELQVLADLTFATPSTRAGPDLRTDHLGLENLGATCYLNVLIQSIFHNCLIREAIMNMEITEQVPSSSNRLNSPEAGNPPDGQGVARPADSLRLHE
jgi:hypothetical protein